MRPDGIPGDVAAKIVAAIRAHHLKANILGHEQAGNAIHWDRAWVDPGGTIFGNGPYAKVPVTFHDAPPGPENEIVIRVYAPERLRRKLAKLLPGKPAVVGGAPEGGQG